MPGLVHWKIVCTQNYIQKDYTLRKGAKGDAESLWWPPFTEGRHFLSFTVVSSPIVLSEVSQNYVVISLRT